jgi:hypothetical protein
LHVGPDSPPNAIDDQQELPKVKDELAGHAAGR